MASARVIQRRSGARLNTTSVQLDLKEKMWYPKVGLEVHCQIASNSKLFSSAGVEFMAVPNSKVNLFDAGIPGTLPVLNRRCVEAALRSAIALGCVINTVSWFDRKHYFYADLPVGYQITQKYKPIAVGGAITFQVDDVAKTVDLRCIQLEQDSGKSIHDNDVNVTLIDLNRAGVGLMEIVTEPQMVSGMEAVCMVRELRHILRAMESCHGNMSLGHMRVDVNISVHDQPSAPVALTEIKNLNSFRSIKNAIEYEIERQIRVKNSGNLVENETRSYDNVAERTLSMREKEKKLDYRFMPEPNLPSLYLDDGGSVSTVGDILNVSLIRDELPELPSVARRRLLELKLQANHVESLIESKDLRNYFEELVYLINDSMEGETDTLRCTTIPDFNKIYSLVTMLYGIFAERGLPIDHVPVEQFLELVFLFPSISNDSAAFVVRTWGTDDSQTSCSALEVIVENGLWLVADVVVLENLCRKTIRDNVKAVLDFKRGKTKKGLNTLVGQVMVKTKRKAAGEIVKKIMLELLTNAK